MMSDLSGIAENLKSCPLPLGSLNGIIDMLMELLPDVEFSNPSRGILGSGKCSIELVLEMKTLLNQLCYM
jgi:hypothetical protein